MFCNNVSIIWISYSRFLFYLRMLLWRCDFHRLKKSSMAWGWRRKKKNKQDGKLPLGLVEETLRSGARRRCRGETWPVSLFAGKGNRTGPWDTGMRTLHTAFASLHLAAQPPSVVDRPSSTRFITQLSARSRRPRADCSFRLAISNKRNVEQRRREGGGARAASILPFPHRAGREIPLACPGEGGTLCRKQYVHTRVCEVNETLSRFSRTGLFSLSFVSQIINILKISALPSQDLDKHKPVTNLRASFVGSSFVFNVVLFIGFIFWGSLKDWVGHL